jgi:hypothetical protein
VAGIRNVAYGIDVARKAWLGPADVLNARPAEEFLAQGARRQRA